VNIYLHEAYNILYDTLDINGWFMLSPPTTAAPLTRNPLNLKGTVSPSQSFIP
jgi:hypothetical protein